MASVVRNSVTGIPAAANNFGASGFFRNPSSMVRKATFWVTGTRERNGTSSPGGRTIGSGAGRGPNCGTSLSFHPIGGPRSDPAMVPGLAPGWSGSPSPRRPGPGASTGPPRSPPGTEPSDDGEPGDDGEPSGDREPSDDGEFSGEGEPDGGADGGADGEAASVRRQCSALHPPAAGRTTSPAQMAPSTTRRRL